MAAADEVAARGKKERKKKFMFHFCCLQNISFSPTRFVYVRVIKAGDRGLAGRCKVSMSKCRREREKEGLTHSRLGFYEITFVTQSQIASPSNTCCCVCTHTHTLCACVELASRFFFLILFVSYENDHSSFVEPSCQCWHSKYWHILTAKVCVQVAYFVKERLYQMSSLLSSEGNIFILNSLSKHQPHSARQNLPHCWGIH